MTELAAARPPRKVFATTFADLPRAAWFYWALVVIPSAAAVLVAAASLPGGGWGKFAALSGAAVTAQLSSVHMARHRRVFHPAIVFVVAGALLLSPSQLAFMCVVQHVPEWLKQRFVWYIQPFNIANYVASTEAAWAAAHAVGGLTAQSGLAAAAAFVLTNRLLLAPMLKLGRGLSLRESRLLAPDDVTLELVLALMALPVAVLWTNSPWLVIVALAPLALIHLTQTSMNRLESAADTISEQNERLEEAHRLVVERSTAALEALSATVDARDTYTAGHSKRVRDYALAIGRELQLDEATLETLAQAALLHDIGKIGVPDSVLLKEGHLTPLEWLVMKSHPEEGARIIERLGYLDDVLPAIRHHHERHDGHGYPAGLSEDRIPLAAQIIHVADSLDAMTTRRVYRDSLTVDAALTEIRRGSGTDFAPACVDALERAFSRGELGAAA